MLPSTENLWNIESIYMLQYFICPSCGYKHVSKQNIIFHAFESHPESVNYLKNITDGSLYDVLCPWDSKNYKNDDDGIDIIDILKPESDTNNDIHEDQIPQENQKVPLEKPKSLDTSLPKFAEKSELKENSSKVTHISTEIQDSTDPKCASCGNSYSQNEGLVSHIRTYHEGRGKLFTSELDVQMFVSELHERNRNLKCDFCGRQFSFPDVCSGRYSYKSFFAAEELRKHIQTVHEKLKEFICQTCGTPFSAQACLKRHIRNIHEGNKDHQCDFCGKAFGHASNLNRHVQVVHQGKKEKRKRRNSKIPAVHI